MACDDAPSHPFGGERATGEDSGVTLTAAPETQDLLPAVTSLRDEVGTTSLPFDLPGVRAAERGRTELLRQLDDYVIPRLEALDAPLLAVVGGSTGAGKSTLVNSLVGAGRHPQRGAATHHPLAGARPPPGRRALVHRRPDPAGPGPRHRYGAAGPPGDLHLVASPALTPGLALLDAPDIDSVVRANRDLAPSCSRPPTSGCSSPPPPGTPTRCRGSCCARRPPAARRWRSCWTACHRRRWRRSASHLASMLREQGLAGRRCSPWPRALGHGRAAGRRGRGAAALLVRRPGPRRAGARASSSVAPSPARSSRSTSGWRSWSPRARRRTRPPTPCRPRRPGLRHRGRGG